MALKLIIYLASVTFLSGCSNPVYYLSSSNANTNYYRTIPLKSDSIKAASYISAVLTMGAANYVSTDKVIAFHVNSHRSYQFGPCQGYYGINYSSGFYRVSKVVNGGPNVNEYLINKMAGNKFFGNYGVNGGINLVKETNAPGELRIGLETTVQNEFGDYLRFRKALPIDAANAITKNSLFATLGMNSDFIVKLRTGSFGFKLAFGSSLRKTINIVNQHDIGVITPVYANFTLHYTNRRWTGFLQGNAGDFAQSAQLGTNYRLSKTKRLSEL